MDFVIELDERPTADRTERIALDAPDAAPSPRALRERARAQDDVTIEPPAGYRFLRQLGRGANGAVFAALQESLARIVAIKVLRPGAGAHADMRRRFFREARLASALEHPGIVRVFDAREEKNRLYLMMELVAGRSLRTHLDAGGPFEEETVRSIAEQVLEALAAAHERGVVHRDVKPDNLLLADDGRVKIADFGIARSLWGPCDITTAGVILGTPLYMAPEQCEATGVDARTDLYSLGATLYHLLAGRAPFDDGNILSIMRKHVYEKPAPIRELVPSLSESFAAIIDRLLAKKAADRFPDARAALRALARAAR